MKKIFSTNSLKLVAIVVMLLDHIAYAFIDVLSPLYFLLRIIGRIAAPVMFYCLAKGYFYSKNKFKYGKRLLIFALISQIPYSLFMSGKFFCFNNYNVIFTLFLGFLCLLSYEKINNKLLKYLSMLLCVLASFYCDWGIFGVIITFIFYLSKKSTYQYVIYALSYLLFLTINTIINKNIISFIIGLGMFLSLILIYLDNGSKGKYNLKYMFYVFYPLHLFVLYLINLSVL